MCQKTCADPDSFCGDHGSLCKWPIAGWTQKKHLDFVPSFVCFLFLFVVSSYCGCVWVLDSSLCQFHYSKETCADGDCRQSAGFS